MRGTGLRRAQRLRASRQLTRAYHCADCDCSPWGRSHQWTKSRRAANRSLGSKPLSEAYHHPPKRRAEFRVTAPARALKGPAWTTSGDARGILIAFLIEGCDTRASPIPSSSHRSSTRLIACHSRRRVWRMSRKRCRTDGGTRESNGGTADGWTILVTFAYVSGTLNFRVQRGN